jgi:hypothetical protein
MIRHGHGINCLYLYRWFLSAWCPECRWSWESFEQPEHCSRQEGFERFADAMLAIHVMVGIDRGEITPPVGFDAPERAVPLSELTRPSAN